MVTVTGPQAFQNLKTQTMGKPLNTKVSLSSVERGDLCKLTERQLAAVGFTPQQAAKAVAGLSQGDVQPLLKYLGLVLAN
jgi:hypothetical protein